MQNKIYYFISKCIIAILQYAVQKWLNLWCKLLFCHNASNDFTIGLCKIIVFIPFRGGHISWDSPNNPCTGSYTVFWKNRATFSIKQVCKKETHSLLFSIYKSAKLYSSLQTISHTDKDTTKTNYHIATVPTPPPSHWPALTLPQPLTSTAYVHLHSSSSDTCTESWQGITKRELHHLTGNVTWLHSKKNRLCSHCTQICLWKIHSNPFATAMMPCAVRL